MNKKKVVEQMAIFVDHIHASIERAESFAKENDLEFTIEPAYGMGGTYAPIEEYNRDKWNGEKVGDYKWFASSQSC